MPHPLLEARETTQVFQAHAIQHNQRSVFPQTVFEQLFEVNLAAHPLFFRSEIFLGGDDYNSYWENGEMVFEYLTFQGFRKAVAVLNAEACLKEAM